MRVLLVEDSARLQEFLSAGLTKLGFAVDIAGDGERGLVYARHNDYDVIILDLMLPKINGTSVLKALRSEGNNAHVLIVTARDTVEDRVNGLRQGADDYLVKPFAFDELVARVEALVRRNYGSKCPEITIDDLRIDTTSHRVNRAGVEVELTRREYALLEYLAQQLGTVVSRQQIEDHLYGERDFPMSNAVDRIVCTLRKKLDATGNVKLLHTRRGIGYVLDVRS